MLLANYMCYSFYSPRSTGLVASIVLSQAGDSCCMVCLHEYHVDFLNGDVATYVLNCCVIYTRWLL